MKQHIYEYIIKSYDFIALVERLDESLAVLSLLLNIPIQDVIVMNSKQSNTYILDPTGKCIYYSSSSSQNDVEVDETRNHELAQIDE